MGQKKEKRPDLMTESLELLELLELLSATENCWLAPPGWRCEGTRAEQGGAGQPVPAVESLQPGGEMEQFSPGSQPSNMVDRYCSTAALYWDFLNILLRSFQLTATYLLKMTKPASPLRKFSAFLLPFNHCVNLNIINPS